MDFNMEAGNWDNERRVNRAKMIANEIINSIHIKKQCSALEFGCGTGLVSFNLCEKFKDIMLIDTSKGMIEKLDLKISNSDVKNMRTSMVDIASGSFLQDKFDVIYSSMVLHHMTDIETTIKNLYTLLNEEGYLCIVDLVEEDGSFHKLEKNFNGYNGFNQNILMKSLEKLGFKNVKTHVFYSDYKVIEDSKVNYSLFLMVARK